MEDMQETPFSSDMISLAICIVLNNGKKNDICEIHILGISTVQLDFGAKIDFIA